jgi:hypothetical protein
VRRSAVTMPGMRKGLLSVLVLAASFVGTADGTAAPQCTLTSSTCPEPFHLVPTLGARVLPQSLPRDEYVPSRWGVFGKVSTRDGTHPSALREVVLDVDKDVRINSRNYPTCEGSGRIEPLNARTAEKACGEALVGRGKALVEVAFPEVTPIRVSSRLLVFNGGEKDGITTLQILLFVPVPRPAAVATVVEITRKGSSGLQTISKIPVIAGGSGSLLNFKFQLGKTYSYKGKRVGYFEAKCPDRVFKASVEKLLFKNEAKVPGVAAQTALTGSLAIPCTPKG